MNAPDKFTSLLSLTREPFPASHKCLIPGSRPDLNVPVRDVLLTNGETVSLYDTSGPYTDAKVEIDVRRGLPDVRGAWVDRAQRHRKLRGPHRTTRWTTGPRTKTATPSAWPNCAPAPRPCSARRAAPSRAPT